jgi:hypothetical protein
VLVSGYQSIDMHCLVLNVKFGGELSMPVLRKSSHFQIARIFFNFNLRRLEKVSPLKKSHFFGSHFSCERDGQPNFKFNIDSKVLFIYRLVPRKPDLFGLPAIFDITPIGRILVDP